LCIFAAVAHVDKVLGSRNYGNMPPRCVQAGESAVKRVAEAVKIER
jgi:hypothetical protein